MSSDKDQTMGSNEIVEASDITRDIARLWLGRMTWQVLPGLSSAHRAVAVQPSSIITKIPFNVRLGSRSVGSGRFICAALDATGPIKDKE